MSEPSAVPGLFWSRFRRVTSSGSYRPELDGIRFVAIAFVFACHLNKDIVRHSAPAFTASLAQSSLFQLVSGLNLGVQLFFVLSGFLLGLPFARAYLAGGPAVRLKSYLLRRVTRLEPPYIAALILFFFLKILGSRGSFFELLPHLGASLLYAHNQIFGRQSDINVVSWSLEVEVQFYLLVPLLAFVLFQIRWRLARRIGIASLCVAAAVVARSFPRDGSWNLSFAGQSAFFLAGLLLADVCCLQSRKRKPHFAWDLCCLTAFGCVLAARFYDSRWWVLSALAMAVCYYAMFRGSWIRRILSWLPIATIGGMSYSIYLLHNYVIALGGMVSERTGATLPFGARLAIQSAILAPLVLSVAAVFYLAIERPCMRPDWPARLRRGLARH
jgi:peptidoglycan/LPS O-acetylase OafA/YrhL